MSRFQSEQNPFDELLKEFTDILASGDEWSMKALTGVFEVATKAITTFSLDEVLHTLGEHFVLREDYEAIKHQDNGHFRDGAYLAEAIRELASKLKQK